MKILFVIAMKKEALDIVKKYNLKKINDNFYKHEIISLLITDVGRNSVTSSLLNLILNDKYDLKNSIIINIGFVGSNKLEVGKVYMVDNSFGYHFDLTPFGDKLYHANYSPVSLSKLDNIKHADCYTSDGFVLKTDIESPVLFDMELNAITPFPYKKLYSIKVVSDSLDKDIYNEFDYSKCLNEIFEITNKIIKENK